jgi:hypothetical protein
VERDDEDVDRLRVDIFLEVDATRVLDGGGGGGGGMTSFAKG